VKIQELCTGFKKRSNRIEIYMANSFSSNELSLWWGRTQIKLSRNDDVISHLKPTEEHVVWLQENFYHFSVNLLQGADRTNVEK